MNQVRGYLTVAIVSVEGRRLDQVFLESGLEVEFCHPYEYRELNGNA